MVTTMGEPRLILVVDDNQLVAMTVEDTLRDAGYAVLTVSSGEEACMLIEQADHLAAVVTDIRLEADTDGWEVARHAREVHPDVAIVYISGRDAPRHECYGVPHSCMLAKPFGCTRLLDAVTDGIERAVATRH
jgi:CheY-like chemotaxis protein